MIILENVTANHVHQNMDMEKKSGEYILFEDDG